mmetsp:Transcript_10196/g.8749  ORF Transcript_10196/g.8749 Transcript_10196/m.8749 type:complete len:414 (-) Transcript_10196:42-1283(-)
MKFLHLALFALCLTSILTTTPYEKLRKGLYESFTHSSNNKFDYKEWQLVDKAPINLPYAADIYTGFIQVDEDGSRLFYQLYPADGATQSDATLNNTKPLILWMQGGPGCTDWIGMLTEVGPFKINKDLTPELAEIHWNQGYNLLFIDQPVGVGFSPAMRNRSTSMEAAGDILKFFQRFFEIYTSLSNNQFFIFGESYAGHYIPAVASTLASANSIQINLAGIGIGNGLTTVYYQAPAFYDTAFAVGIVDEKTLAKISDLGKQSQDAFNQGEWGKAGDFFGDIQDIIGDFNITGVQDPYDYRSDGSEEDYYAEWLGKDVVKSAFGVDPTVPYVDCSPIVWDNFNADLGMSYESNITYLLNNNIPIVLYYGQDDLVCPLVGNRDWLKTVGWSGFAKFEAQPTVKWVDQDNNVIGT